MSNINDLEKNKFFLENWYVTIDTESVFFSSEVETDFSVNNINDLEKKKFNANWQIKVLNTF